MPVEFLMDAQVTTLGRFARLPTRAQPERFFFLHKGARTRVAQRRLPHTQLGFAVRRRTVRFLDTFLADPLDVPREVVEHTASQLGIDSACFPACAERAMIL